MAKTRLSGCAFVERGYGQVEPNHLSAQRTGRIYAQLPAKASIDVLENGQFVKYDYENKEVNFTGKGEWMLVLNEVKLYRDHTDYNDFAMVKGDYAAKVYSPIDGENVTYDNSRDYTDIAREDQYEPDTTNDPFIVEQFGREPKMMGEGQTMVPRVFGTLLGDIYTTNTVNVAEPALGDVLCVDPATGYLVAEASAAQGSGAMRWQVVKVYTLADRQPAVKLMRIA